HIANTFVITAPARELRRPGAEGDTTVMRRIKKEAFVGTILGLSMVLAGEAKAQEQGPGWKPQPVVLKVHDPDLQDTARVRNGRLRKTDEEFTNEQAVVKFFADGKSGLYVEMRTGA